MSNNGEALPEPYKAPPLREHERLASNALHLPKRDVPLAEPNALERRSSVSFLVTFHGTEVPPGWEADQERILRREVNLCWPRTTVERYVLPWSDPNSDPVGDMRRAGESYYLRPETIEDDDDYGDEIRGAGI